MERRAAELPDTPSFAVHDDQDLVDGGQRDSAATLEGEQRALRRGAAWFSAALAATMRDSRSALG